MFGILVHLWPTPPQVCTLTERFREDIELMPTLGSVDSERRSLADIVDYLMKAPKPHLDFEPKVMQKVLCFFKRRLHL